MSAILSKMLDRLFAGLTSGPNLNCRPHSSRQRVDWTQFARLQDGQPGEFLLRLLSDKKSTQIQARVPLPKTLGKPAPGRKKGAQSPQPTSPAAEVGNSAKAADEPMESPEDRQQRESWSAQQALLSKLRSLAEDARDYEQDTGAHVLHVGFPLLSLPPGTAGLTMSAWGAGKRLLAPIAFVPVTLEVRAAVPPVISIRGIYEGSDFLVPNEALFAWLERQTGQRILPESNGSGAMPESETAGDTDDVSADGFPAEESSRESPEPSQSTMPGLDPLAEINDLVGRVAKVLQLPPAVITADSFAELRPAPRGDEDRPQAEIVPAAVLGLFPMNNQGLLRDTQAMVDNQAALRGPVLSFLSAASLFGQESSQSASDEEPTPAESSPTVDSDPESERLFEQERLVTAADPCQARGVRLARKAQGLVIHGPPGTGKSQTITNIIGDHLSRGERVLLVCDKRTALDVVARRLEHIGLRSLCALIHDPKHDQRRLYMQVREQLEQLPDTTDRNRAAAQLRALDRQLQKSHDTLARSWSLVMSPDRQRQVSFHERMGEWLESAVPGIELGSNIKSSAATARSPHKPRSSVVSDQRKSAGPAVTPVRLEDLEDQWSDVSDLVSRAHAISWDNHPWRSCAALTLNEFLSRSGRDLRRQLADLVECAEALDQLRDEAAPPLRVPEKLKQTSLSGPTSFPEQQAALRDLSASLKTCLAEFDGPARKIWSSFSRTALDQTRQRLAEIDLHRQSLEERLDPALLLILRDAGTSFADLAGQKGIVEEFLRACDHWYGWLLFGVRNRANAVLRAYGLPPGATSAERLRRFLEGIMTRRLVANTLNEALAVAVPAQASNASVDQGNDVALIAQWDTLARMVGLLETAASMGLDLAVRNALANNDSRFVAVLERLAERASALEDLRRHLTDAGLFQDEWLQSLIARACAGEMIKVDLLPLTERLDSLGEVLRIREKLNQLPPPLSETAEQALAGSMDVETRLKFIRHQVLTDEIDQWLTSNPPLQGLDGAELSHLHREIRRLQREKYPCVRDLILEQWTHRQRDRLLASTGSRLSSLGADLRRRLTTRGERAMRLRQVVAIGGKISGGDPLFDLRPVWMASPETVAQIFPREALFDVVIFDEASQCRLEEALPVLTRGKRVVIAGDPKQLPPTRFFESGVITSDNVEAETEQELFEAHQSDVEDLLTAALSMNIHESHLDVHYRSRNADLVEFSNQQFYGSRLQAIPGHPRNRIRFAPITLYHVAGLYEDRTNPVEVQQVVKIVADLLRRSEPPSIGIACFNVTQRDLILDALSDLASEDSDFAVRLAAARMRLGTGASEGLFVKNLENVQGDERDHMIISTTYGPDRQGKFYRRFGPLGQVGGGRRLNVLVTRAREEVHLITSIPAELYRNLPPVAEGQNPGGGWLLFAYLSYAERLAEHYQAWRAASSEVGALPVVKINDLPSRTPSTVARQLAELMARRHGLGSDTHWGNEGFCVDLAFHHPLRVEDRTLGLLVDGTRFLNTDDPVAWDVFRTTVLEEQGWRLVRCWTPQFFRDPEETLRQIAVEANRIAETDPDPDEIPVQPD